MRISGVFKLLAGASALLLFGCSTHPKLAVEKMSSAEIQATPYLALNRDHPGTPVDVHKYLVPGKYTIVAYFSPKVADCAYFGQRLYKMVQHKPNIAVRTVNIDRPEAPGVDWQSPIAHQYEITFVPYFQIYDPSEILRAHGRPALEQVSQWIKETPN